MCTVPCFIRALKAFQHIFQMVYSGTGEGFLKFPVCLRPEYFPENKRLKSAKQTDVSIDPGLMGFKNWWV
jgi:hypothetical protein